MNLGPFVSATLVSGFRVRIPCFLDPNFVIWITTFLETGLTEKLSAWCTMLKSKKHTEKERHATKKPLKNEFNQAYPLAQLSGLSKLLDGPFKFQNVLKKVQKHFKQ
jgi:hypothetical protein